MYFDDKFVGIVNGDTNHAVVLRAARISTNVLK